MIRFLITFSLIMNQSSWPLLTLQPSWPHLSCVPFTSNPAVGPSHWQVFLLDSWLQMAWLSPSAISPPESSSYTVTMKPTSSSSIALLSFIFPLSLSEIILYSYWQVYHPSLLGCKPMRSETWMCSPWIAGAKSTAWRSVGRYKFICSLQTTEALKF